jgi:hypothetical protein
VTGGAFIEEEEGSGVMDWVDGSTEVLLPSGLMGTMQAAWWSTKEQANMVLVKVTYPPCDHCERALAPELFTARRDAVTLL